MLDLCIVGGKVVFPGQDVEPVNIGVRNGRIAGFYAPEKSIAAEDTLNAAGLYILPGLIDPHVHFGLYQPWADDWATESQSAALGGVTTVIDFFRDGPSYHQLVPRLIEEAQAGSLVDFAFHLGLLTDTHVAEVPEYVEEYGITSFKFYYFYGGSVREFFGADDPLNLDDGDLAAILQQLHDISPALLLCVHCENMAIQRRRMRDLWPPQENTLRYWERTRPDFVETSSVLTALHLARSLNTRIYVVHLTAGSSVVALREHPQLLDTGSVIETCAHYLSRTVDAPTGLLAKVIPPIRYQQDADELWAGIHEGFVSTIGSDHAASRLAQKGGETLENTLNAFPAVGWTLPVLLSEGYHRRGLALETIADITSRRVAETFGLYPRKGAMQIGADADFVLVDLDRAGTAMARSFGGSSDYSIYAGMTLQGWPVMTISQGELIARDGQVVAKAGRGRYLRREAA
jgi:dihydroorotase-like cyclic amidohydrolase